ncbi:hypothetical protein LCM4579_18805 [Ensifer sp. LCM 4579]|nr:hypothetical protein LCM4579_18805 [Ensifer sp. LCM 4579]
MTASVEAANPIGIFAPAEEGSTVQSNRDFRLLPAELGDSSVGINPDRLRQAAAPTHQRCLCSMRRRHGQR